MRGSSATAKLARYDDSEGKACAAALTGVTVHKYVLARPATERDCDPSMAIPSQTPTLVGPVSTAAAAGGTAADATETHPDAPATLSGAARIEPGNSTIAEEVPPHAVAAAARMAVFGAPRPSCAPPAAGTEPPDEGNNVAPEPRRTMSCVGEAQPHCGANPSDCVARRRGLQGAVTGHTTGIPGTPTAVTSMDEGAEKTTCTDDPDDRKAAETSEGTGRREVNCRDPADENAEVGVDRIEVPARVTTSPPCGHRALRGSYAITSVAPASLQKQYEG